MACKRQSSKRTVPGEHLHVRVSLKNTKTVISSVMSFVLEALIVLWQANNFGSEDSLDEVVPLVCEGELSAELSDINGL